MDNDPIGATSQTDDVAAETPQETGVFVHLARDKDAVARLQEKAGRLGHAGAPINVLAQVRMINSEIGAEAYIFRHVELSQEMLTR